MIDAPLRSPSTQFSRRPPRGATVDHPRAAAALIDFLIGTSGTLGGRRRPNGGSNSELRWPSELCSEPGSQLTRRLRPETRERRAVRYQRRVASPLARLLGWILGSLLA